MRTCVYAFVRVGLHPCSFLNSRLSWYLFVCVCVRMWIPQAHRSSICSGDGGSKEKIPIDKLTPRPSIALLQCITNTAVNIIKIDYSLTQLYIELYI